MDEEYLNSLGMGGDYSNLADEDLAPFNETMAAAVNSTGQVQVTPQTSGLANFFNSLVVAPSGSQNTGSTLGNVLNYLSQSLVQKPTTQQQQITQQGVSRVVYGGTASSGLFSNPLMWVAIVAVLGLVLFLVLRKR